MKAAVVCAKGIGDGLMMLIAAHQLHKHGYKVTTFQNHLHVLYPFFPYCQFDSLLPDSNLVPALKSFDLIILQNDNSKSSFQIIDLYRRKELQGLCVFYPSYSPLKHNTLTPRDRIFNPTLPMTANIAKSIAFILNTKTFSRDNGIVIPQNLSKSKYKKRILIHPTSSCLTRTWSKSKFLAVAKGLKQAGFDPVFCVSPSERAAWVNLTKKKFLVPYFPTLKELVPFVYESSFLIGNESGTGHLASNLGLPTLIIAKCPKQMLLWRPGWHPGRVLTPSPIIPNIKGMRLKGIFWKAWVSPKKVLKIFFNMINHPSDL